MKQREIKFRAWNNVNKHMVFSFAIHSKDGKAKDEFIMDGNVLYKDLNYTLMQYTGLKDRNGKEIYEGDVVINEQHTNEPRQVAWSESNASWYLYPLGVVKQDEVDVDVFNTAGSFGMKWFTKGWYKEKYEDQYAVEVIGNIYSNPELLIKPTL